jgi:hypothetical protein
LAGGYGAAISPPLISFHIFDWSQAPSAAAQETLVREYCATHHHSWLQAAQAEYDAAVAAALAKLRAVLAASVAFNTDALVRAEKEGVEWSKKFKRPFLLDRFLQRSWPLSLSDQCATRWTDEDSWEDYDRME